MTDSAMTCSRFGELLSAYLENDLDAGTHAHLEAHAGSCAACGAIVSDLRAIQREAPLLAELAPSRDLWSGIAERIEAPVLSLGAPDARRDQRPSRRWLAAAAAGLVVATAGLTYQVTVGVLDRQPQSVQVGARPLAEAPPVASEPSAGGNSGTSATGPVRAPAPDARSGRGATQRLASSAARGADHASDTRALDDRSPEPAVRNAAATLGIEAYDREIARLQTLAHARKAQLDPATVAVIDRNLHVIEAAIAQTRAALAADPASRFLNERLSTALDKKVELLRTAALLPSGT